MKIFVVSLLGSTGRRTSIQKQLDSAGLEFEFIDAVNGSELTQQDLEKECDLKIINSNPKWLNTGTIACSMSHKLAYGKVIEQNLSHALILEDDVIIPDNFPQLLNNIEKNLLIDEVVMLYYRNNKTTYFSTKNARQVGTDFQMLFLLNKDNILSSTVAYVVSQPICRALLEATSPINAGPDSWDVFYKEKAYKRMSVVFPRPIGDAHLKSDINYVEANHSKLIVVISKIINHYKIPIVYGLLQRKREVIEAEMSDFSLTDQASEFDKD